MILGAPTRKQQETLWQHRQFSLRIRGSIHTALRMQTSRVVFLADLSLGTFASLAGDGTISHRAVTKFSMSSKKIDHLEQLQVFDQKSEFGLSRTRCPRRYGLVSESAYIPTRTG